MIEINLLPGPKKKGGGLGLSLPSFSELTSSVKDPLLLGAVGAWIVAGAFIGGVWYTHTAQIREVQPRLEQTRGEARNLRAVIAQKRRLEDLRDSLIVELNAIREIDADRYVWPHILEEVTAALPEFTWLVTLDNVPAAPASDGLSDFEAPVRFSIEGRTSDIQAYTRFVRQLEDSPWLRDIQFGSTQTVMEAERQVTSFQIQGTFSPADSAYVRVVPVTEVAR